MGEQLEHEPPVGALARAAASTLRSICARVSSISLSYCTPDGQAVTQAMHPRQLSRWSHERGRELVMALLHQHDPPARRVHLLAPEPVGRAGGQAEAAVHAVVDQVERGRAGRVEGAHRSTPGRTRRSGRSCSFTRRMSASAASSRGPHGSTRSRTSAGRRAPRRGVSGAQRRHRLGASVAVVEPQPGEPQPGAAHQQGRMRVGGREQRPAGRSGAPTRARSCPARRRAPLRRRAGASQSRRRPPPARRRAPHRSSRGRPPRPAGRGARRRSAPACRPRAGLPADVEAHVLERRVREAAAAAASLPASLVRPTRRGGRRAAAGAGARPPRAMAPSVPKDPANSLARSYPATFLITLPPRLRDGPVRERHAHPDHQVAHAAVAGAQRTGVRGGHHAADGGAAARRVEREHLAGRGEGALRVRQRDAGLEDGGEVARVVLDDPRAPPSRSRPRGSSAARPAHDSLVPAPRTRTGSRLRGPASSAASSSRELGVASRAVGGHQKRSASPACSSGWRR